MGELGWELHHSMNDMEKIMIFYVKLVKNLILLILVLMP